MANASQASCYMLVWPRVMNQQLRVKRLLPLTAVPGSATGRRGIAAGGRRPLRPDAVARRPSAAGSYRSSGARARQQPDVTETDAGSVAPGPLAYGAAGPAHVPDGQWSGVSVPRAQPAL